MRRDAPTDVCKPVVTVKDEPRVCLGCISTVLFERGRDMRGAVAGDGVGEQPADGLHIGFLVELGWPL